MARLNLTSTRSSTRETSIYRDPTPDSALHVPRRVAANDRRPSPSGNSDKENRGGREDHANAKSQSQMPTPNSDSISSRSNKRRRLGERTESAPSLTSSSGTEREEIVDLQFYDPDQNEDLRREVRQGLRNSMRDLRDRRDDLLKPDNNDLETMLMQQQRLMSKVRQTTDATLDSRYLVEHSNLALRKATNAATGDTAAGIDVDEFVSKCITFMRLSDRTLVEHQGDQGSMSTQTRRNRRPVQSNADTDEEDATDDVLDWESLGSRACIPSVRRPSLPGHLLGPLSLQKRVRQSQARSQRQRREDLGPVTKPQELRATDLQAAEQSNVTSVAKKISEKLVATIKQQQTLAQAEVDSWPDMSDEALEDKQRKLFDKLMITADGGLSYLPFVINPTSFGQTIENMFYVSFLIKDSSAAIQLDDNHLPVLYASKPRTISEQREQNAARHQAIFSLDYVTWRRLIDAYDIHEPMIPHRDDEEGQQVSGNGWYS